MPHAFCFFFTALQIPFCVVVGWIMGIQMDLNFQLFETATLFITVLVVAFMLQVGLLIISSYNFWMMLWAIIDFPCGVAFYNIFFVSSFFHMFLLFASYDPEVVLHIAWLFRVSMWCYFKKLYWAFIHFFNVYNDAIKTSCITHEKCNKNLLDLNVATFHILILGT